LAPGWPATTLNEDFAHYLKQQACAARIYYVDDRAADTPSLRLAHVHLPERSFRNTAHSARRLGKRVSGISCRGLKREEHDVDRAVPFAICFACASVKQRVAPLGNDTYLLTCDGNGYADTGDTMQCLAALANATCSPKAQAARFIDSSTASQLHVCRRLHLLDNGKTPRVYKLSEVGHGYHKKGQDDPKLGGLHPHCRCTLVTLMPGFGFDKAGMVKYISRTHDEWAKQHS
jgi:hypothetical protein